MHRLLKACFEGHTGYVEIGVGTIEHDGRRWIPIDDLSGAGFRVALKEGQQLYFGPAVRSVQGRMGKANCKGSGVCWVDVDRMDLPDSLKVMMPTLIVQSGGGFHLYWKLRTYCENLEALEKANASLSHAVGGDSAHNIDRMLRVPGSFNHKYDPPRECQLIHYDPSVAYEVEQLGVLDRLDRKTIHKILTGDQRGFKSRSERDWSIVRALVTAGADDSTILQIFAANSCGDKYREEGIKGPLYLSHTLQKVRETAPGAQGVSAYVEEDHCYYIATSKGRARVSTFTIEPTLLLETDTEDFIVGHVRAAGTNHVWEDVVWPRSSFNGVASLSKCLTKAAWVWLGRDQDVRGLLAMLINKLQADGVPLARATGVIGRHTVEGDPRHFFVSNDSVLASDGSYWARPSDAPIMWVDHGREHPQLALQDRGWGPEDMRRLVELLPRINEEPKMWALIGWHMACALKSELERLGYRFPILNLTGTKGSGKTTVVLRIFQPLLGYTAPVSYDIDTTHFVSMSLMGSSNGVPIAFSEYRAATEGEFLRRVLLSYDTGMDARGNPDQTTTQYPLIAPFSLDGEDKLEDPAALERMIVVVLSPQTIEEGSESFSAFEELRSLDLGAYALPYYRHVLTMDVAAVLDEAEDAVHQAFPASLPDRVRRNLTVCWTGVLAFISFAAEYGCECTVETGASVLWHALGNVYSTELGRAPIGADDLVEFVINGAAIATRRYPWELEDGVLWFQLAPAYEAYVQHRASQRKPSLSRNALRMQLGELERDYMVPPAVRQLKNRRVLAYGVSLSRASQRGLDVPETFNTKIIEFHIKE